MTADVVYRGSFTTFDPARPTTHALAVWRGRIVALGDEALALAPEARRREDLGGAAVFPGFHDAHCHTCPYGFALGDLDLSSPGVSSLEELYAAVEGRARGLGPGEWIVGTGYDQNKLGGRHPDRRRLDAASGGRPVWLQHTSGHFCTVSSAALALIGPRLDEPVEGGLVRRDEAGEPTGLLEEQAQRLVRSLVLPRSLEQIAAAIGRAHDRYLAEGLTSVCDAGIAGGWIGQSPLELAGYQLARETGRLRVRTSVMLSSDLLAPVVAHEADEVGLALGQAGGVRTGLGDEWLRIGPLKVFSDGSLVGRTCWMEEGFDDDPGNRGYPQADPEQLRAVIVGAHLAGFQVATHAIGDRAVSFVLDCYAEALARRPRPDHRHRIEHCGLTTDDSLARLARLGVVPVPQARFIGELGEGMLAALGPARAALAYRLRSLREAAVCLPGSSDRPVVDGAPLKGIADAVRRLTEAGRPFAPGEALTVEEAMRAYTEGSAYAEHAEADRGRLGLGMLADFVALGADPRAVPVDEIASVEVVATAVGGELAVDRR